MERREGRATGEGPQERICDRDLVCHELLEAPQVCQEALEASPALNPFSSDSSELEVTKGGDPLELQKAAAARARNQGKHLLRWAQALHVRQ